MLDKGRLVWEHSKVDDWDRLGGYLCPKVLTECVVLRRARKLHEQTHTPVAVLAKAMLS